MKLLVAAGFLLIAGLLAIIAYQVNRTTWSAADKACAGFSVNSDDERLCKLGRATDELNQITRSR
jgi:hypothetical protein